MTDEAAIKAHEERVQRENEQKNRTAQLLRIEHHLKLLDLGVDEELSLAYRSEGVFPVVKLTTLSEEQIKESRAYLEKMKTDIEAMA